MESEIRLLSKEGFNFPSRGSGRNYVGELPTQKSYLMCFAIWDGQMILTGVT